MAQIGPLCPLPYPPWICRLCDNLMLKGKRVKRQSFVEARFMLILAFSAAEGNLSRFLAHFQHSTGITYSRRGDLLFGSSLLKNQSACKWNQLSEHPNGWWTVSVRQSHFWPKASFLYCKNDLILTHIRVQWKTQPKVAWLPGVLTINLLFFFVELIIFETPIINHNLKWGKHSVQKWP